MSKKRIEKIGFFNESEYKAGLKKDDSVLTRVVGIINLLVPDARRMPKEWLRKRSKRKRESARIRNTAIGKGVKKKENKQKRTGERTNERTKKKVNVQVKKQVKQTDVRTDRENK